MSTALPILLVSAVAAFAVVGLRGDETTAPSTPAAVDIAATGPRFDSLDELVAAADLIVEGRIVAVDAGRVITDPSDPTAGFSTALFQLDVTRSFRGGARAPLIVEQEAALLDGAPITVNGLTANEVGDTGFWFLVRGSADAFPYVALVNEQARILVDDAGRISGADSPFRESSSADELRSALQE
ncbi:hypothetical protein [Ilumatobacter sp.]|uniref:hypothetical protein n=1 Tax=Ilumatobacter sp. TaxID=1967498 RepID=UPI003C72FAE0